MSELILSSFLARDAFVKTNLLAIAMMFVRPSVRSDRLSVWDRCALWSYGALQRGFKFTVG